MSKSWPVKDPDEILDYPFNWEPRDLGDNDIEEVSASVVTGDITVLANTIQALKTIHRLSGGTEDETCVINLRITVTDGQIFEQQVRIRIKTRT